MSAFGYVDVGFFHNKFKGLEPRVKNQVVLRVKGKGSGTKKFMPRHLWRGEYKAVNAVMSAALLSVLFIQYMDESGALAWHHPFGEW